MWSLQYGRREILPASFSECRLLDPVLFLRSVSSTAAVTRHISRWRRKFKSEKSPSENLHFWTYKTKDSFFCYTTHLIYVQRAFYAQLVETAEVPFKGYLVINLIIFKPLNNLHIKSRHSIYDLNFFTSIDTRTRYIHVLFTSFRAYHLLFSSVKKAAYFVYVFPEQCLVKKKECLPYCLDRRY